ncbi:HD domain-containing protein [Flavihumibacter sp.]|uniref:HD domain-containing protein n=1 Tax=Flavihumibacter sp. TaxID=1913981 RepID=UPI002FC6D1A1
MTETGFLALKEKIIARLSEGLDKRLTYHNLAHTLDVLEQAERIAIEEKISDPKALLLVKLAALYHDTGFLDTYKGHEERSCEIMLHDLGGNSLTTGDLDRISGMIMATKIPQNPANLMEEVICDADLDYLGRDDFPPISNNLKKEFLVFGVIKEEKDWDPLQIGFFEKHHYFTASSRMIRQPRKMDFLKSLKASGK